MNNDLRILLVVVLISSLCLPVGVVRSDSSGAWVAEIDGVRVLHVEGAPYAMGYQQGSLLHDAAMENFRGLIRFSIQLGYNMTFFLDV